MKRTSAWAIAVGFALAACGGSNVTPGGDGGDVVMGTDGTGIDDNVTPPDVGGGDAQPMGFVCPPTPPTDGTACPAPGAECSYGNDPNVNCRRVARCGTDTGHWMLQDPEGCMVDAGAPACPAAAPATMDSCTSNGQLCAYGDGTRCQCADCPPSGPACMAGPLRWYCFPPIADARCPHDPPNLGTACSVEGADCDYGACRGNGWDARCQGGVWVNEHTACAE